MTTETGTRRCSTCRRIKPQSEFYFRNRERTELQYCCKSCKSMYNRQWYGRNSAKHRRDVLRNSELYRQRAAAVALAAKDRPCADCGARFDPCAMDFDHVRGIKVAAVSELVRRGARPEVVLREIAKCEVVCSNCHRVRTQRRGWGFQGARLDDNQPANDEGGDATPDEALF